MRRIAVIGLGYVGLPVAVAFARHFPGTMGFDRDRAKVERLRAGVDPTGQATPAELRAGNPGFVSDPAELAAADFYVVAVPTPIDAGHRPDLSALREASRTVGAALGRGDIVVFESTVYPGVTEEVCGPLLEEASGLVAGRDFHLGYSPERINPGDPEHSLARVHKIIAAQDEATLEVIAACYGSIVEAGIHRAPSIRVAEAAKVIENIQRDLNIALMNELAIIFDRLGLDTSEVLAAAGTKWNFHHYRPGLVGGHCIGVDPYYLTSKAEEVGIHPQVVLAGRRINDGMGAFVAARVLKELTAAGRTIGGARVAVLGVAFKENHGDVRNSRVPDVVRELAEFGVRALVHDPLVDADETQREHGIELVEAEALRDVDAVVLAVAHTGLGALALWIANEGDGPVPLLDVAWGVERKDVPATTPYWRL